MSLEIVSKERGGVAVAFIRARAIPVIRKMSSLVFMYSVESERRTSDKRSETVKYDVVAAGLLRGHADRNRHFFRAITHLSVL